MNLSLKLTYSNGILIAGVCLHREKSGKLEIRGEMLVQRDRF